MSTPTFQLATDVFDGWREDVLTGTPPVLWPAGTDELALLEIGPGLVTLFGGAPGSGKTALAMQLGTDALRLTPSLKALICNVEMPPQVLLDRQLSRLSGIDSSTIRHRRIKAVHAERIDQAMDTLEPLAERLAFIRPPFDLENVAVSADAFEADLLVLDYIQRIPPPGQHADKRVSVNASIDYLRRFADAGVAVLVLAAVGRTRDNKGRSSYDGEALNLASFRESSELEFGSDDAYMLIPDKDGADDGTVSLTVRHLKARHTRPTDLLLQFDRRIQRFSTREDRHPRQSDRGAAPATGGSISAALAAAWDRTRPADDSTPGVDS